MNGASEGNHGSEDETPLEKVAEAHEETVVSAKPEALMHLEDKEQCLVPEDRISEMQNNATSMDADVEHSRASMNMIESEEDAVLEVSTPFSTVIPSNGVASVTESPSTNQGLLHQIETLQQDNAQLQSALEQSQAALHALQSKQQIWKEKAIAATQKDRQYIRELQDELGAVEARRVEERESLEGQLRDVSSQLSDLVCQLSAKENAMEEEGAWQKEREELLHAVSTAKGECSMWKDKAEEKEEEIVVLKKSYGFLEKKSAAALADRKDELTKRKEIEGKASALEEVVEGLNQRLVQVTEEKEKCMALVTERDLTVAELNEKLLVAKDRQNEKVEAEKSQAEKRIADLEKQLQEMEETGKKSEENLTAMKRELEKMEEEVMALREKQKTLNAEKTAAEEQQRIVQNQLNEERHASKEQKEKLEQLQEKTRVWKEKVVAKSQAEGQRMNLMEEVIQILSAAFVQLHSQVQDLEKKCSFERLFSPLAEEEPTRVEPLMIFHSLFHAPVVNLGALIQASQTVSSSTSRSKHEGRNGVGSSVSESDNDLRICLSCVVDCGAEILEKCFLTVRNGHEKELKFTESERSFQREQRQRQEWEKEARAAQLAMEEGEKKYHLLQKELEDAKSTMLAMSAQLETETTKKIEEALRHAEEKWMNKNEELQQALVYKGVQHKAQLQQLESRCQLLQKEIRQLKKAGERSPPSFSPSLPYDAREGAPQSGSFLVNHPDRKGSPSMPSHLTPTDGMPRTASVRSSSATFSVGEGEDRGQEGQGGSPRDGSLISSVGESGVGNNSCGHRIGEGNASDGAVHRALTSHSYMKNIMYQYLSSTDTVRVKMIPAIVTVLGFNPDEKRAIALANPSCPTLR